MPFQQQINEVDNAEEPTPTNKEEQKEYNNV